MSTTFSLSLELILLMNWLLENEKEKLKLLIHDAIKSGFFTEVEKLDALDNEEINNMHASILDFMLYLEDTLLEALEKKEIDFQSKERIEATLKKVNTSDIDVKTMWNSMQQARTTINKTRKQHDDTKKHMSNDEVKKTLFSQILKNWDPKNNDPVN